jgi:ornithine carbamoyltransferase
MTLCLDQGLTPINATPQGVSNLRIAVATAAPTQMQLNRQSLGSVSIEPLSTRDADLLLTCARTLQRSGDAGQKQSLRGKNLGLLCESDDSEEALRFRRAATDLGARVAHIRPELSLSSSDSDIVKTGRMLGRLYDGIECIGVDAAIVKRLGAAANVPVYDGIASRNHPTAKLAGQLGPAHAFDESHRFMVQAVLLSTLN